MIRAARQGNMPLMQRIQQKRTGLGQCGDRFLDHGPLIWVLYFNWPAFHQTKNENVK